MSQTKYTTQEQIEEMRREILKEKQKLQGIVRKRRPPLETVGQVLFLSTVVLLVGAIISINITKSRGEIPSIGGYALFLIESGSMEPTLKTGSVILSHKPKDPGTLKEDTIVTFRTLSDKIVTHRIVGVVTSGNGQIGYQTKGDNPQNTVDPNLLTPDRVIGVYIAKVPLT
ncbi:signal peptidase I [Dehalobacter sp. DCM]|uniref:signal peptidase I n=1 Tax=Dehalobacter sp. DCM TaxID=2907827 RepID=UPI003081D018|nr:signal peptidase I [Dehalobacter sp. DCM]